jgi:predicted AAA+ superfamily ATPase
MSEAPSITRFLADEIRSHRKSILLMGPRQVGKSTLLNSMKPDLSINLAKEKEFIDHSTDVELLENLIERSKPKVVFIDEIQRIPSLLNTIQSLIDEKKIRFFLSGSSAKKLKSGKANLLPGRLITYELGGLAACELGYKMDSQKALRLGTLPEIYLTEQNEISCKILDSYSLTYLNEEIKAEVQSLDLRGFSRFLFKAAEVSGQILDITKVSTKAKVSRTSCHRYFEILEDTLIVKKCPSHLVEGLQTVKHPRFYFFDTGVLNSLLGSYDHAADRRGFLFEHLFYNQLQNSFFTKAKKARIEYFRTHSGHEIDFVIEANKKTFLIECKSSDFDKKSIQSMRFFDENKNIKTEKFIATLDERPTKIENIWALPWQEVLKEIVL